MKKSLLALLLAMEVVLVRSQEKYRTPVMPPSPTSSVFARYGDDKPDLASGMVNIPISLFNVEAPGLNIPLNITYRTSGINVADTPYPAGYGWVFSSGFRITRTMLGRPDERFPFRQSNAGEDYETLRPGIISQQIANVYGINQNELFDTQKDIFTLHLPSGSYKFYINKVGNSYEAVSIGHDLKIEVMIASGGFKVTDESGVIYMFGFDSTTSFVDYTEFAGNEGWGTAWVLREIILPNNEKISFSWTRVNINSYALETATPISIKDYKPTDCNNNTSYEVIDDGGIIRHDSYRYTNVLMLSRITYPAGVVDFSYKSAQNPFLESIVLKNKNNEVVRNVSFAYGAMNANQDHLLLQSLNVNGDLYSFAYNGYRFTKNSTSLDYWGFYNGKNNTTLIPNLTLQLFTGATLGNSGLPPNVNVQVGNADRSVSAEHMKALMLTRINYPTSGYSEYEYEPHEFQPQSVQSSGLFLNDPAPIGMGGGLRVSQIKSYPSAGSVPSVKIYKYGENEDGLGITSAVPTLDTFIDEYWKGDQLASGCQTGHNFDSYRLMNVNALSNYSKFLIDNTPVWYNAVTEYVNGLKTGYTFTYANDDIYYDLNAKVVKSPYVFNYNNLFNRGPLLKSIISYKKIDQTYDPVQEIVNEYELINGSMSDISNVIIDRNNLFSYLDGAGPDFRDGIAVEGNWFAASERYHTIPYSISMRYNRLKKVNTIVNYEAGSVTSTEDYFYSNTNYQLIKTVKSSSVNGKSISKEFKHANNFSEPVFVEMARRNMLTPVVEEITSVGSAIVKKVKTSYAEGTTGIISPQNITVEIPGSTPETMATFHSYDEKGNLLSVSGPGAPKSSYIYGYDKRYPIAEITNADLNEVAYGDFESMADYFPVSTTVRDWLVSDAPYSTNASSSFSVDKYTGKLSCKAPSLTSKTVPAGTYIVSFYAKGAGGITVNGVQQVVTNAWKLYSFRLSNITSVTINNPIGVLIDDLRLHPEQTLMTTYTYLPLVGVTSSTDAKGETTYYDYDEFQRLIAVKNDDKNIVKSYSYNYANISANWQASGLTRCQTLDGGNTGLVEREEKDMNPASITYNQTRWLVDYGQAANCPATCALNYVVDNSLGSVTVKVTKSYRDELSTRFRFKIKYDSIYQNGQIQTMTEELTLDVGELEKQATFIVNAIMMVEVELLEIYSY